MAVARKIKPDTDHEIELDDGQKVNITIKNSEFTQGDREANTEFISEFKFAADRLEKLRNRSIDAFSDADYEKGKADYKKFKKKIEYLMPEADHFICRLLRKWDMALTEEDEAAGNFVPLTPEGLRTLEQAIRIDVFLKILTLPEEMSYEKKDDSSAEYRNGAATLKESKEVSPISTQDTTLQ